MLNELDYHITWSLNADVMIASRKTSSRNTNMVKKILQVCCKNLTQRCGEKKIVHFQNCQVWKSIWFHPFGVVAKFVCLHIEESAIQMASITQVSRSSSLICIFNVFWKLLLLFCSSLPWPQYKECSSTAMTQKRHTGPKTFYEFLCASLNTFKFLALLLDSAINPRISGVSKSRHQFVIGLSPPWRPLCLLSFLGTLY